MSLDLNRSSIDKLNKIYSFSEELLNRIIAKIPLESYDSGLVAGDVIRYNPNIQKYIRAIATDNVKAEVFGIVENIDQDGTMNVVLNGSITLESNRFINNNGTNSGGNDIYFLSSTTPGYLTNAGATGLNNIIKPLYYNSPHGKYTGLVRNYLGFKNTAVATTESFFKLINFSQNLSKSIFLDSINYKLEINNLSISANSLNFTFKSLIDFSNLASDVNESLDISFLNLPYDIVVSNDGNDILIFAKGFNKIYHININSGNIARLKYVINLNVAGSPEDKIWAVDDALTSMTVSTKSMNRDVTQFDFKNSHFDVSSKIYYFKRSFSKTNKFKWKKTHENYAHGLVASVPRPEPLGSETNFNLTNGVFRTSDIKVKNKYFTLSTKSLIADQKYYKTKINGWKTPIYNSNLYGITGYVGRVNSIFYNSHDVYMKSDHFFYWYPPLQLSSDIPYLDILNNINSYKFKCNTGIKNYQILKEYDNTLNDDLSHKYSGGLNYSYCWVTFDTSGTTPQTQITYPYGITALAKLKSNNIFNNVPLNTFSYSYASIPTIPPYEQQILDSKTSIADNFFIFGILYQYIKVLTEEKCNHLVVIKYPKYSHNNESVFKFFEYSNITNDIVPQNVSDYGLISSFKPNNFFPEERNKYHILIENYFMNLPLQTGSTECPSFNTDVILTAINVNQLTSFELFTSNDRYFLCTSNYILVWTYATSSYNIVYTDSFNTSKFYYNNQGEFFIIDNKCYRYNPSTQIFNLIYT